MNCTFSTRVTVDEIARAWLTRLIELCDEANAKLHSWGRKARWIDVVEGSPRDHDHAAVSRKYGPAGPWTTEPIGRALHTSIIHLGVAVQHLAGIRALLASGQVIFPVAPIVRSIVEICGRVTWTMGASRRIRKSKATLRQAGDSQGPDHGDMRIVVWNMSHWQRTDADRHAACARS